MHKTSAVIQPWAWLEDIATQNLLSQPISLSLSPLFFPIHSSSFPCTLCLCFTSQHLSLTPPSPSPPSFCLCISHLFIRPLSTRITQLILTSFSLSLHVNSPLTLSLFLLPTQSLQLSSLPTSIHFFDGVLYRTHFHCCSAIEC